VYSAVGPGNDANGNGDDNFHQLEFGWWAPMAYWPTGHGSPLGDVGDQWIVNCHPIKI